MRFYNTLTHRIEEFAPAEPPTVTMYNCGPTVYDFAHIGNFRAFVFADVLRRFLELTGHDVKQVMNITDVGHMTEDQLADGAGEDKMQLASRRLKEAKKAGTLPEGVQIDDPGNPYNVAKFYTQAFLQDARKLGLKVADEEATRMPRATGHVDEMKRMIGRLIETGHAYVAEDGAVYYSVETFPEYGRLSGNTLDKLRGGAGGRVNDAHQRAKKHPADFLLWKPDPSHLMKWDSPWGQGYPGWHIECSAMAQAVLGRETIDIHTGGEDNIFPHHECEIAQSRGATGKDRFARFWMHTRFLLVDGQKMSKSKGNFHTVRDVLSWDFGASDLARARALRLELCKAHYRSNMNFTRRGLKDSLSAAMKFYEYYVTCYSAEDKKSLEADLSHPAVAEFVAALSDDLNMSGALAVVFSWMSKNNDNDRTRAAVMNRFNQVLNLVPTGKIRSGPGRVINASIELKGTTEAKALLSEVDLWAEEKCEKIDEARKARDFATADRLRAELQDAGYEVQQTKEGTVAKKSLA